MLAQLDNAINQLLNLSRTGRSPDEKTVAINAASAELFKFICGPVGEYSAGRPVSRVNFQENGLTYSLLSNFYRVDQVTINASQIGASVLVWDIGQTFGPRLYDVELVTPAYRGATTQTPALKFRPDNQIRQRLNSNVVPPSQEVPIGEYFPNNTVAIYPEPNQVYAKVLLFPISCKIVYDSQGKYDPNLSVDFDWPDDALFPLAIRAIKYLGLNIPNQLILQAASQIQQQLV
jgi:hypothetical protein